MKTPGTWTLDGLFEGRPEARALFELVREYLGTLGPVEMEVMKTQVSFRSRNKFAWVWLPQLWTKKRPESSITLTFDLERRITDPRIAEAVEPRPGHWTHHVVIAHAGQFDETVRGWLRDSFRWGLETHGRP